MMFTMYRTVKGEEVGQCVSSGCELCGVLCCFKVSVQLHHELQKLLRMAPVRASPAVLTQGLFLLHACLSRLFCQFICKDLVQDKSLKMSGPSYQ